MATDDTITTENETVVDTEVRDDDPQEGKLVYADDSGNLVDDFYKSEDGKKDLAKIAKDVNDKYEKALQLSKGYRDRFTSDYGLFMCELEEKNFPWPDCANVNVPITLEGVMRLWARFYGELFEDWNRVVAFRPMGENDRPDEELLTVHTNWQMRTEIRDFRRQMCRAIYLFIFGDVSCHSYFDTVTNRNKHEVLTCDELIRPYSYTSVEPDYSDLTWIAKRMKREKFQMERTEGEYHKETLAKVLKKQPSYGDQQEGSELHDKQEQISGEKKPLEDKAPFDLIHWEGWLDLPQQVRQRYCQLHMDLGTKKVLKLKIHEEPDWKEKERFERQTRELEMFQQALEQYEQMQMQHQQMVAQMQQMGPEAQMGPGGPMGPPTGPPPLPPPPMPPVWMDEGVTGPPPMVKSPIYMFRHAVCIEPLAGNLGIGLGRIEADYNRSGNTMMNQFVDSATSANVKSWIVTDGVQFEDGDPVLGPGRLNRIRLSGQKLGDHLHEFSPSPANPQMVQAIEMIYNWAQSAGQTPDILSGAAGKSGETWRGVSTRVEQAMKQISALSTGLIEFVEGIYDNNSRLNEKFMPEEDLLWVNDDMVAPNGQLRGGQNHTVSRAMYTMKFRFVLTADGKFTSKAQKIAEADELVMNIMQLPLPPQVTWPILKEALKEAFEARGAYHYVPLLEGIQLPPMGPPPGEGPAGPSGAGGGAPTGEPV